LSNLVGFAYGTSGVLGWGLVIALRRKKAGWGSKALLLFGDDFTETSGSIPESPFLFN